MSSDAVVVARAQFQRAPVAFGFDSSFDACVRKRDSAKPLEIVGSQYSDIGVARIV